MPQNEVFRVQMPVSPGISGSPLLNEKNQVIGVIIAPGAWNPDFDSLNQVVRIRNLQRNLVPGQANNRR
jgi:V8-like Glu-specific endopeptidase